MLPRTLSGAAGRSVHRVAQTLARLEARQAGGGERRHQAAEKAVVVSVSRLPEEILAQLGEKD